MKFYSMLLRICPVPIIQKGSELLQFITPHWKFYLTRPDKSFRFYLMRVASSVPPACLRIVDVRGIMGRACAKQWGAHVQSNGLRMCKAMACAWRWLYLLANTSAPLKDQSSMLSLSCMDMVSPDKLSRLLLSMKPVQLNNLSASVLVAKMQRYFLASLHRLGNCGLLGLNQSKGSSPSSRAFSERSCLLLLC